MSIGELNRTGTDAEAQVVDLSAKVGATDGRVPLDRSYASLDRVEDYLGAMMDKLAAGEREALIRQVEQYVGATLVKNAGGQWVTRDDGGRPGPRVTKLPELGRYGFNPDIVVNHFTRTRLPGLLRDNTEVFDIPHRRQVTNHQLGAVTEELAALAKDVSDLRGKKTKLEVGVDGLDLLEEALAKIAAPTVDRDRRRRVHARAVLFIGEVFRSKRKRAKWELCTEPENVAIGQLSIDDFAPMDLVRAVRPDDEPGLLREGVDEEIEARR